MGKETMLVPEREKNKILAVDAVILPSAQVMDKAINLSTSLGESPITLGKRDYIPHITLAMGYINNLEKAEKAMKKIASLFKPFE